MGWKSPHIVVPCAIVVKTSVEFVKKKKRKKKKKVKKSVVNVFVNLSRIVLEKIEIIIHLNVFEENIFKEK